MGNSFLGLSPWRQTDRQGRRAEVRGSCSVGRSRSESWTQGCGGRSRPLGQAFPQGRVGEGPVPGAGAAVVAGGACRAGDSGPHPRRREHQPLGSCPSVLPVPARPFPRKSSMSETGVDGCAGPHLELASSRPGSVGLQRLLPSTPAGLQPQPRLGHTALSSSFMTEVHAGMHAQCRFSSHAHA